VVNNLPILLVIILLLLVLLEEVEEEEEMKVEVVVVVVVVRKNLGKGLKRVYDLFPIVSKFLLDSNSSFDFDVQRELYPVLFLSKRDLFFSIRCPRNPQKKE
jgi:hypothetical protein